jgi:hypothetical protein
MACKSSIVDNTCMITDYPAIINTPLLCSPKCGFGVSKIDGCDHVVGATQACIKQRSFVRECLCTYPHCLSLNCTQVCTRCRTPFCCRCHPSIMFASRHLYATYASLASSSLPFARYTMTAMLLKPAVAHLCLLPVVPHPACLAQTGVGTSRRGLRSTHMAASV